MNEKDSDEGKKRKKTPKKKNKKESKKQSHFKAKKPKQVDREPSSFSSLSSSSSSSFDDSDSDMELPLKRFKMKFEEEKMKYKLPRPVATYINEHFEMYIPDKELKTGTLVNNPVPDNLDPVKKLGDFAMIILKDSKHTRTANELINADNVLKKIQGKIRDIMGPLSRMLNVVLNVVEEATRSNDENVTVLLTDLKESMEQTALLVGQSSNTVSYHRRYNIPNSWMRNTSQAKKLLKEKAELLQKHGTNLFGKKFRKHIVELTKSKKTTIDAFSGQKPKHKGLKPFSRASPQYHQGRSAVLRGEPSLYQKKEATKTSKDGSQTIVERISSQIKTAEITGKEMENSVSVSPNMQEPFLNVVSTKSMILVQEENLQLLHSMIKKFFSRERNQNLALLPLAGRLKHFQEAWKLITKDPNILSLTLRRHGTHICVPKTSKYHCVL